MAKLLATTRSSLKSFQPRKEPRHGHGRRFDPRTQAVFCLASGCGRRPCEPLQLVIAFILHCGRVSTLQAAGSVRSETRHRAQIGRICCDARASVGSISIRCCGRRSWPRKQARAFSTMKQKLTKATPDDVKILMTNARNVSVKQIVELYCLRWQIEVYQPGMPLKRWFVSTRRLRLKSRPERCSIIRRWITCEPRPRISR